MIQTLIVRSSIIICMVQEIPLESTICGYVLVLRKIVTSQYYVGDGLWNCSGVRFRLSRDFVSSKTSSFCGSGLRCSI